MAKPSRCLRPKQSPDDQNAKSRMHGQFPDRVKQAETHVE